MTTPTTSPEVLPRWASKSDVTDPVAPHPAAHVRWRDLPLREDFPAHQYDASKSGLPALCGQGIWGKYPHPDTLKAARSSDEQDDVLHCSACRVARRQLEGQ